MGFPIAIQVLAQDLYVFYLCCFFYGMGGARISVACNSGCLEIWRGSDGGGPMLHAIHFFFALGNFLGPVIAAPMVKEEKGNSATHMIP